MKHTITLLLLSLSTLILGQKNDLKELEELKKSIRESTFYDSSTVFKNGLKAIKIAKKLNKKSEIATIFQYYGSFYFYSSDYHKARYYYKKSIAIAKQDNNQELINSTKIRMAFVLAEFDLSRAEKEFLRLEKIAKKNRWHKNTAEIYNGLGNIYDQRQMKDHALKHYITGLKIAEKHHLNYHQSILLNNIALIKHSNNQAQDAAKDLQLALKLINGLSEKRLTLNINNNLGILEKEQKNYKSSIKYFHNTVKLAKSIGFPAGIGAAYLNLSDSYSSNKDYQLALQYTDTAYNILKQKGQPDQIGLSLLLKSSIYIERNEFNKAESFISDFFEYNKKHPYVKNETDAHRLLSEIYTKKNDYKLALKHQKLFHQLSDSLSNLASKDKLAQLQVLYGKEKIETELANEKQRYSLMAKDVELKRTKTQFQFVLTISFFILLIGILFLINIFNSHKQQQLFSQKLIQNIDDERSRISKDLHDDLGQSLSIIKSKINLFNQSKIQNINGIEGDLGDVIEQTRTISHHLHPSFVQKLGLERSLNSLIEKTQNSTNLFCTLEIKCDLSTLDLNQETQIFRIIQECVSNTLKHANATALKIEIQEVNQNIIVTYRDNGIGMTKENKAHKGIGMLTMAERAKTFMGKIQISSPKSKGFTLKIIFKKN